MQITEALWEKKLNISTCADGYEKDDTHHSRYEPTAYPVLQRLANSDHICRDNVLVDYGCGKGRVGLFLDHTIGCRTIGVEYDVQVYDQATENLRSYSARHPRCRAEFVCADAERYPVGDADRFYFFNPFSAHLLRGVLQRIYESWYENPREMKLFFYYTLDSYLSLLRGKDMLRLVEEIDCRDLFPGADDREKILVFRIDA